jgi:hypothetical protein
MADAPVNNEKLPQQGVPRPELASDPEEDDLSDLDGTITPLAQTTTL